MGLKDYLKSLDIHILTYSVFITGLDIIFLICICQYVKIASSYYISIFAFFLCIAIAGFITVFARNEKFKSFYAYFLILQIVVTIMFVIVACMTIEYNPDFFRSLDPINTNFDKIRESLQCCELYRYQTDESHKSDESYIVRIYPESCCPKLNDQGECDKDHAYQIGCLVALENKFHLYKTLTIAATSTSMIFQSLLFFSFYKNAGY